MGGKMVVRAARVGDGLSPARAGSGECNRARVAGGEVASRGCGLRRTHAWARGAAPLFWHKPPSSRSGFPAAPHSRAPATHNARWWRSPQGCWRPPSLLGLPEIPPPPPPTPTPPHLPPSQVVAFIKGTRTSPSCGFSYRVLNILNESGADYEVGLIRIDLISFNVTALELVQLVSLFAAHGRACVTRDWCDAGIAGLAAVGSWECRQAGPSLSSLPPVSRACHAPGYCPAYLLAPSLTHLSLCVCQVVDVLDEVYNPGVREAIKSYTQWPTIPQASHAWGGGVPGGCMPEAGLQTEHGSQLGM